MAELVNEATTTHGGNVTVKKDGEDLFRVHQLSSSHGTSVTQFKNSPKINPKTGKPFKNDIQV
jgi:hypothetical protein